MPLPRTPYPVALVEFDQQAVYSSDLRSLDLELNVGYLADSLTVVLDNTRLLSDFVRKEQEVNVWLGYASDPYLWDKSELVHVFSGAVDGVVPTFADDRSLTVRCRDWTRLLIDSQADPGWAYGGLADAGIVVLLAKQAGLIPKVSPTLVPISDDEMQSWLGGGTEGHPEVGTSGWEIVQTLAVRNDYIAYVTPARELYWGPRGTDWRPVTGLFGVRVPSTTPTDPTLDTWKYLEPPFDVLGVTCDDSVLITNKVTVVRWMGLEMVQPDGFIAGSALDETRIKAARGRIVEKRIASTWAKTPADCEAQAKALLKSLTRDTLTAHASVEGDPRLVGDSKLRLDGAALGRFKNDYYIEAARHHYGPDGYTVDLQLSSLKPEASEVYRGALGTGVEDPESAAAGAAAEAGAGHPTACRQQWRVNFGFRQPYRNPNTICGGNPNLHRGVDLIIDGKPNQGRGTPIGAFQAGTVAAITHEDFGGNGIIIRMATGLYSRYFHWDSIAVKVGQVVTQCDTLGVLGATGTEGNPHLHFEVSHGINGDCPPTIDPHPYYADSIGDPNAPVPSTTATTSGHANAAAPGRLPVMQADDSSHWRFVYSTKALGFAWEHETGIPVAVFLAISASECGWGGAAKPPNVMLFGIGADSTHRSHVFADNPMNFRVYDNANQAYLDFVDLVTSGIYANAYAKVKASHDGEQFVKDIQAAGYSGTATAEDRNWSTTIIRLMGETTALLQSAESSA